MATRTVEVTGGKKMALALESLSQKITSGGELKVGFLEDARYPGEKGKPALQVAQVAFWNEFGTSRAPARPFFRTTISTQSAAWGTGFAKAVAAVNYDGAKALALLGTKMQSDIRQSIVEWTSPPNAPYTVARKGFNKPLIDTGTMQRRVDYKVGK